MQYYKENPDLGYESLLEQYRDMYLELYPAITELKKIEKSLKAEALLQNRPAQIDGANVTIRKGYTHTSWDSKALNGYAAAHPEIERFRKISEIKPSAVIKIKAD